jgi:hypothetical protein
VLASSAKEVELGHHLRSLGIADLINGATSADDAQRSKPCRRAGERSDRHRRYAV